MNEVAHGHRFLDQRGEHARSRHGHIHTPRRVEQPFVARVVDSSDNSIDTELGLREQTEDEVGFVIAGSRDDHVVCLEL